MNPYVRPIPATAVSRRTLLVNAGLAAVALTGLGGCGTSGASAPAKASGGSVTAKAGDIPVGSGKIFKDAEAVITQPTAGQFKAFSSICTHARCPVAQVTTTINCTCHGSKFALADGAVVNGPATTPLPAKPLQVKGDTLTVSA